MFTILESIVITGGGSVTNDAAPLTPTARDDGEGGEDDGEGGEGLVGVLLTDCAWVRLGTTGEGEVGVGLDLSMADNFAAAAFACGRGPTLTLFLVAILFLVVPMDFLFFFFFLLLGEWRGFTTSSLHQCHTLQDYCS